MGSSPWILSSRCIGLKHALQEFLLSDAKRVGGVFSVLWWRRYSAPELAQRADSLVSLT
jgi:hypothetical protein